MKYKLKVYTIEHPGQRKDAQGNPHQEDSIFPAHGKGRDTDRLFILCDGMGGHDAGEVASATVCGSMSRKILQSPENKEHFTTDDFEIALDAAYRELDRKDSGALKKMGTTMTFLKLHSGGALIAHIGDSRVYHIRPGNNGENTEILFVTRDHSLINDLIKIGELTLEEARFSPRKNVITRAMQPNMETRCKADIYTTEDIQPGDFFYLCSDGMLEQPEMDDGSALRNIFSLDGGDDDEKVNILEGATAENRDNHTAIIVHILEVEEDVDDEDEVVDKVVENNDTDDDKIVVDIDDSHFYNNDVETILAEEKVDEVEIPRVRVMKTQSTPQNPRTPRRSMKSPGAAHIAGAVPPPPRAKVMYRKSVFSRPAPMPAYKKLSFTGKIKRFLDDLFS